jgi:hypothetical protein
MTTCSRCFAQLSVLTLIVVAQQYIGPLATGDEGK